MPSLLLAALYIVTTDALEVIGLRPCEVGPALLALGLWTTAAVVLLAVTP